MTASVALEGVAARGAAVRGGPRPVLAGVTLRAETGILAILGGPRDGTSLLLDLIDASARPRAGRVLVCGRAPDDVRDRIARVSLDAPLPEVLRVAEVCALAADLRSEAARPAAERLAVLGAAALSERRVRSLGAAERRTVALALALTSAKVDVLVIEEPFVALEPVAPRLVVEALRARATSACVIVTTASVEDASRLGERVGRLSAGAYSGVASGEPHAVADGLPGGVITIVVAADAGRAGASALVSALGVDVDVSHVETTAFAARDGVDAGAMVSVVGADGLRLARAVTRAIVATGVDVERITRGERR